MVDHVIPIHTCNKSLPHKGVPYKGGGTHLSTVRIIDVKHGNSLIVEEKYQ